MLLGPNNEVFISDAAPNNGAVFILRGKEKKTLISGLNRPYGLALNGGYLYVDEPKSVKRYKYDTRAMTVGAAEEIVSLK